MARRAPPRRRRLRLRALSGCARVPASRKQGGGRGLGLEEIAKLAPGKTPQGVVCYAVLHSWRGVCSSSWDELDALRRGTSSRPVAHAAGFREIQLGI
jgi:hypothetical protein